MPILKHRNPASAPGDWYIDTECIDCAASRIVAPGLIVRRGDLSVFGRQPEGEEDERAAWRAVLVCPTASVGRVSGGSPPAGVFPWQLAPGVFMCGYNARSSYGASSYFVTRSSGNLLIDSPRFTRKLVQAFTNAGGIAHILLTHQDDVADADQYARAFGARVWIHEHDRAAAPYAGDILTGAESASIEDGVLAIPVPGHTRGSVVYLVDYLYLFTGDSLAWDMKRGDLTAFRDACWYSWEEQTASLDRLIARRFEWVLPGHGGFAHRPAEEMTQRLRALVRRMREVR
jgi:glyoxylase-like metal-dependent hydrolase (beta-lactamase superfamily II)